MYAKERYTKEISVEEFLREYFDEERILQKCRECSGFQTTWSCPEFDFNVREYWEQFKTYEVIVERVFLDGTKTPEEAEQRLYSEKKIFNRDMLEKEKSTEGATALYAEECEECAVCARLEGKPCRRPDVMRYSIESLGGLAVKLVKEKFGFDVLWSDGTSIPKYYILLGGQLKR